MIRYGPHVDRILKAIKRRGRPTRHWTSEINSIFNNVRSPFIRLPFFLSRAESLNSYLWDMIIALQVILIMSGEVSKRVRIIGSYVSHRELSRTRIDLFDIACKTRNFGKIEITALRLLICITTGGGSYHSIWGKNGHSLSRAVVLVAGQLLATQIFFSKSDFPSRFVQSLEAGQQYWGWNRLFSFSIMQVSSHQEGARMLCVYIIILLHSHNTFH